MGVGKLHILKMENFEAIRFDWDISIEINIKTCHISITKTFITPLWQNIYLAKHLQLDNC